MKNDEEIKGKFIEIIKRKIKNNHEESGFKLIDRICNETLEDLNLIKFKSPFKSFKIHLKKDQLREVKGLIKQSNSLY